MTRFRNRRIAMVPAARRNTVNAQLEAAGWGPDNFSIPLVKSAGPNTVITHYALDAALTDEQLEFLDSIQNVIIRNEGPLGTPNRLTKALNSQGLKRKPEEDMP